MTAVLSRPTTTAEPRGAALDPIPFTRLLRVELSKATDTRAARWLLALSGLLTMAVVLLPLLRPGSIEQSYSNYLFYATTGAVILLPVVAIMTLTSEWTQRTVLTTFMQEPRRERVIAAKVTVAGILGVAAMVFAAVTSVIAVVIASAVGRHVDSDLSWSVALGFVLYVLIVMLMGVAFGALLHNTAAAIVLYFLLPTIVGIVGGAVGWVHHWLDNTLTFGWVQRGEWDGHVGPILASAALWVVLPLALGLVRTARREVK